MTGLLDMIRDGMAAGGPVIVILGVLSVYSLTLLLVKAVQLVGVLGGRTRRAEALATIRRGDRVGARRALEDGGGPVDRVLLVALRALEGGLDRAAATEEAERAGNAELERLRRNLRTLDVIAMVSPLLGLLGTVLGMIESFRQLDMAGGAANASVLAGGIWQALLTTAAGLSVAIPAAIAANLMAARVDRVAHVIETDVGHLMAAVRATGAE